MKIEVFLPLLQKAKHIGNGEYEAICPAHADRNPSLHIKQSQEKILINCKAGCQPEDILATLKLTMADLFLARETKREIVATYDYVDEEGQFLFQVVRFTPKSFAQRHRNGAGEWVWNLEGVRRVIYHLPEILMGDGDVYLVEGEKDADALWEWGQVATTSPMGAANWKPEYAHYLQGKDVIIIPDNDPAGLAYAQAIARSCLPVAASVRTAILPEAKDFSDWKTRHDIEELPGLISDVSALFKVQKPAYKKNMDAISWTVNDLTFRASALAQERTGVHAKIAILQDLQELAWSRINIEKSEERIRLSNQVERGDEAIRRNLDLFCAGLWEFNISSLSPELMFGDENIKPPAFYLYPFIMDGGGTILFAPPGRGKSYTALLWAQSINTGTSKFWKVEKCPVLYVNLERSSKSMRRRLALINKVLGLRAEQPLLAFHARGKSLAQIEYSVAHAIDKWRIKVIILDSMSRTGIGDLSDNRTGNAIIDTLNNLCETWVALGHTPRGDENHLYGSIMQDAGADLVVKLHSQVSDRHLGVAYELVKKNDMPNIPPELWAFSFDDWRLENFRKARASEFPDISLQKPNMLQLITDYILNQETADAHTQEIAEELGYSRTAVSLALNRSGRFVKTRKEDRKQYFGVRQPDVQSAWADD